MERETRQCQNCKKDFTIELDDFYFYEKMKISASNWCSDCRAMRRLAWRNERSLYHRECAKCDARLISIYSKEKPFPVYCNECWYGDSWDGLEYGLEIASIAKVVWIVISLLT